jgi:hypothetical protein
MSMLDHETQQLNGFHEMLAGLDSEGQASHLRNGFLPDSPEGLIEAGIRCIPLIESGDYTIVDAATDRLAAVRVKLNLLGETPEVHRALEQFDAKIQERQKEGRSDTFWGCTLLAVLAAILGGLALYIVHLFTR